MVLDFSQQIRLESLSPQTEFEGKVISFLKDWFSERPTVSVQTSGSTGSPKIFEIEKVRMRNSANMTCDFLSLKRGSPALLCLPVEYISGKMMVVRAIERGLCLHIKTPSAQPLCDLDEEMGFCAMSPLQVENSLDKVHLLDNVIIGGAQVSEHLKEMLHLKLQPSDSRSHIFETYGMSETLSHIAMKQLYPSSQDYFTVFQGVELSLDARGCLQIWAPQLNSDVLQTNDLVELKNEKQFKFLGRVDHVINSAGLKIRPEELEVFIKKHISNELIFAGLNDNKLGQKLVLVIEGEKSKTLTRTLDALLENLGSNFSKNHRPKETHYLEKFPRLPNGKLDRRTIIDLLDT